MAKIIEQRIGWADSPATDLAGYTLYYKVDDGVELTYADASVDVGLPPLVDINGTELRVITLTDIINDLAETVYRFGIAARDARGNESAITEVLVEVDVTPPAPVPFVQEV